MNSLEIIDVLGADTELLVKSDAWLSNHCHHLQQQLAILASECRTIMDAQTIKQALQQKNMVAVRHYDDTTSDIIIDIRPVADGVAALANDITNESMPQDAIFQQLDVWEEDGYDITASCNARLNRP